MQYVYCSELSIYDEGTSACWISISVSATNMSMYKNQCMNNSIMRNLLEDNPRICQLTDVLKIC